MDPLNPSPLTILEYNEGSTSLKPNKISQGMVQTRNKIISSIVTIFAGIRKRWSYKANRSKAMSFYAKANLYGLDIQPVQTAILSLFGGYLGPRGKWDPRSDASVWANYAPTLEKQLSDTRVYPHNLDPADLTKEKLQKIKEENEEGENKKNKIALSITLDGHYMALLIDLEAKEIEFFDSQGIYPQRRMIQESESSLMDKLQLIQKTFFDKDHRKIKYTRKAKQKDRHNCVIHVCNFFEKRLIQKQSFEDFLSNDATNIDSYKQDYLAQSMLNHYDRSKGTSGEKNYNDYKKKGITIYHE